jgi:deoxyribodipyrimidine photo-lyase
VKKRIIVWFRTDLRLHDHLPLHTATQESAEVLPVYVFDDHFWGKTAFGFNKTAYFRTRFLIESVADLQLNLRQKGTELLIRKGNTAPILAQLAHNWNATHLYYYEDNIHEEKQIADGVVTALDGIGVRSVAFWGHTLLHPDDLPFGIRQMPDVFSDFRRKTERNTVIRPCLPAPDRIPLAHEYGISLLPAIQDFGLTPTDDDPRAVLPFKGGENEGLKRLNYYLWEASLLRQYKETRNGLLGGDYSSKFSAWLAPGCLSPRKIMEEVERYENQIIRNESTYWLFFELLWRDYFRFASVKHGNKIFFRSGMSDFPLHFKGDKKRFQLWAEGQTGYPIVDANMRELKATGFMSNRGRQIVGSFLTKNLGVDWRMGAEWFESLLIDYDPASNYGNWNYVAGVGFDPRGFRFFNPTKQSQDYDPQGQYLKTWLPELKNVPASRLFEPWRWDVNEQRKYNVLVGRDYPAAVVDLMASAKENEIEFKKAMQREGIKVNNSLIRKFVK